MEQTAWLLPLVNTFLDARQWHLDICLTSKQLLIAFVQRFALALI